MQHCLVMQSAPSPLPAENLYPVSVIIVNHNAGELLTRCVTAAMRSAAQVVVVDNKSKDTSMRDMQAHFEGNTRLVTVLSGVNNGFAAGCNLGVAAANQPWLLFLNPDCIVSEQAIGNLYSVLTSDPNVGMVGGLLTNLDGTEQGGGRRAVPTPWRSFVRAFGLAPLSRRWPKLFFDFYLHNQPLPDCPVEVEAISGALMMVWRSSLERVGGWDEHYFLHCEDLDLCMRFRQHGLRILFVPSAPVLHYLGHSSKSRPFFVEWHKHRGMVRFYHVFFSHQYPGGLMWLVYCGVWFRFVVVAASHMSKIATRKLKALFAW